MPPALAAAREIDRQLKDGTDLGPLMGVPVIVYRARFLAAIVPPVMGPVATK